MEKILPVKPIGRSRSAVFLLRLTDADVVLLFAFAFLAVGGIQRFADAYAHGVLQAFVSMFNTSEFLALLAIYSVCKWEDHSIVLSKDDFLIITACALFLLLPTSAPTPYRRHRCWPLFLVLAS